MADATNTDPTAARIAELIASTRKWAEYGCPDMKYAMADAVLLCDMAERCTAAEAIVGKAHDLCHDLCGKVGPEEFAEGCRREQVKLFGRSPTADRVAELEGRLAEAEQLLPDEETWRCAASLVMDGHDEIDCNIVAGYVHGLKCRPNIASGPAPTAKEAEELWNSTRTSASLPDTTWD